MFRRRRRRRHSNCNLIGLIIILIGVFMLIYIMPWQLWYLIVASIFIMVGSIICKLS